MRPAAARLLQAPFVLLLIYVVAFVLVVAAPGNPFEREGGRALSPLAEQALRQRYGMEDNWRFFWRYLGRVLRGDLGESLQYENWSCNEIIVAGLPVSVTIGLTAMAIAVAGGLALGTIGAVRRHGWADYASLAVAVIGVSVPTFVTGAALLVLLSVTVPLLPAGSWGSPIDVIRPALTLSLLPMAYITRLTRMGMIEVLSSDYVRTARAKGLRESQVLWRHALRNAILPVLSYLGPATASALTGSFVVERVFNVPGLGIHFVNSILNRDPMLILATVLVYSSLIILLNLVVDLAYRLVDPRVSAEAPA